MKRITGACIEKVKEANVIIELVKSYQTTEDPRQGKDFKTTTGHKLILNTNKATAFAYADGQKGYNSISYLTELQGKTFIEAIKEIAEIANIIIEEEEYEQINENVAIATNGQTQITEPTPIKVATAKPVRKKPIDRKKEFKSYRDQMLAESGISDEHQKIEVSREIKGQDSKNVIDIYTSGTIRDFNYSKPDPTGNDVIIKYIGLDGKEVMVQRIVKGQPRGKLFPFVRVRHQHPQHHKSKAGKPKKYESPSGTGTHLYFPKYLIQAYQEHRQFETLYIQEGEKKADKFCIHGLYSVGIGGITSIAQNGALPEEFGRIIERCGVKNIVFVVDSDYQDIGNSSKEAVNHRPNQFFHAVNNFKSYFVEFRNSDIHLNIYFGHVNGSEHKGVDDLLVAHYGNEKSVTDDIRATLNHPKGMGKYLNIYNITVTNASKLMEFWKLHDKEAFFAHHNDKLIERKFFVFKRQKYRYDEDTFDFVLDQPLLEDELFYNTHTSEIKNKEVTKYGFDYVGLLNFMQNRGFHRYKLNSKRYTYVQLGSDRLIYENDIEELKDYVLDFCRDNIKSKQERKDVMNMIISGQEKYLGSKTFSNLSFSKPLLHKNTISKQYYYFKDNFIEITPEGINEMEYKQMNGYVWSDRIKEKEFNLNKPLWDAKVSEDGTLDFKIKDHAWECVFFQFMHKTSNFYHRKDIEELTADEMAEVNEHLVNKLTAMGYCLHTYFNPSVTKIVFALDGKESEIGASNGRTGKSLMGYALCQILPHVMIDGKKFNTDNYPFENVSERTPLICLDDPEENFKIERFYSLVTGAFMVERKGVGTVLIPRESTPKVFVPTNHAIKLRDSSARDRAFITSYSDYYSDERKPSDPEEYGHQFFDDWDTEENNRFFNLAFRALQLYLQIGLLPIAGEDIKKRQYLAEMKGDFKIWADEYFNSEQEIAFSSEKSNNLNRRILRSEMSSAWVKAAGDKRFAGSSHSFKVKILAFCNYYGYVFNPSVASRDPKTKIKTNEHGGRDVSGGVEYFTIGEPLKI